jgi:hypothetical protein
VFDYGPENDPKSGFQVTFSSRMHNGEDQPKELYYSNGGEMNLNTNMVSSFGGLQERHAKDMGMQANLLPEMSLKKTDEKVETGANTGGDNLTSGHMRNWMECVRNKKETNAPVEAGYSHAIACIMANAAARTGTKVTFDEAKQEIMAGSKAFNI